MASMSGILMAPVSAFSMVSATRAARRRSSSSWSNSRVSAMVSSARVADTIEKALTGAIQIPDMLAKRPPPKGRIKAFAIEPEVTINNNWSNRYTMVEVTGLDRPGLLFELTATLSKLNLNIASAHVATFGERVVDVFYVTDLLGAKITAATRQAAIKRALMTLFGASEQSAPKQPATVG